MLGMDTARQAIDVRSVVGYMPEGPCLPLDQTAADFMVYAAGTAGLPPGAARQRASDVLTLVGLADERFRYMGDYSTGMKQRAKLAQAIVHDPKLVFLDEPTAGLDPSGRDEMLDLIGRLGGFGIDVVVSSHVLRDIERTCDWVVMLQEGTLLHSGPIGGGSERGAISMTLNDNVEEVVMALQARGATVLVSRNRLTIEAPDDELFDLIRDTVAACGASVRRLDAGAATLEEMFLRMGRRS